jgi:hypothetical protein
MMSLSISVPARNVSMIAPNPARKFTHCVISRPITLPATAPTMISTSATDIATRMEMMEASSASPIQTAEASQTFSMHTFSRWQARVRTCGSKLQRERA